VATLRVVKRNSTSNFYKIGGKTTKVILHKDDIKHHLKMKPITHKKRKTQKIKKKKRRKQPSTNH
jgi:hypothetical protein